MLEDKVLMGELAPEHIRSEKKHGKHNSFHQIADRR